MFNDVFKFKFSICFSTMVNHIVMYRATALFSVPVDLDMEGQSHMTIPKKGIQLPSWNKSGRNQEIFLFISQTHFFLLCRFVPFIVNILISYLYNIWKSGTTVLCQVIKKIFLFEFSCFMLVKYRSIKCSTNPCLKRKIIKE